MFFPAHFKKKLTACFLAFCLLPGNVSAAAAVPKTRTVVYTALGDSIASGYKLDNKSDAYVTRYGRYLSASTSNMAQVGLNSAGLIEKLSSDDKMKKQLARSDIVTISMGGNDLLPIFSSLKPSSPSGLMAAVRTVTSNSMNTRCQKAISQFSDNWKKIVSQVHSLAPNARVIAVTLINPYRGMKIDLALVHFDFGSYADQYVRKINDVIKKNASSGRYAVADGYSIFKKNASQKLTNADLSTFDFDPHPNAAGHALLYEAHKAVAVTFPDDDLSLQGTDKVVIPVGHDHASARFSAVPLLSCFAAKDAGQSVSYSLEDAGETEASLNASSGMLTVRHAGTAVLKATVSAEGGRLKVSAVQTVRVTKAAAVKSPIAGRGFFPYAVLGVLLLLFLLAAFWLIRRKRRRRA